MLLYSFSLKYYPDVLMLITLDKLRAKLEADAHFLSILRVLGMAVAYAFTLVVTRTLGASAGGIFALF